jgi:hypothetical protein
LSIGICRWPSGWCGGISRTPMRLEALHVGERGPGPADIAEHERGLRAVQSSRQRHGIILRNPVKHFYRVFEPPHPDQAFSPEHHDKRVVVILRRQDLKSRVIRACFGEVPCDPARRQPEGSARGSGRRTGTGSGGGTDGDTDCRRSIRRRESLPGARASAGGMAGLPGDVKGVARSGTPPGRSTLIR